MINGAIERVEIRVPIDVDNELVSLAVIVTVIAVIGLNGIVLVAIGVFLGLIGASSAQFKNFLLKGPGQTSIVRESRGDSFIEIIGAVVEISLKMF
jgi:hypothetical protein